MDLIIASGNAHKVEEIRALLSCVFASVRSLHDLGLTQNTVEDGETFLDNARKKARELHQATGLAALADDSGLCVSALGGAPGVRSARFSADFPAEGVLLGAAPGTDLANNRLLLHKLADKTDRSAYFACALCLLMPDGQEITAEGRVNGIILFAPQGECGFGYDPLFYCPEVGKTFAACTKEEKNRVSHRARALLALREQL